MKKEKNKNEKKRKGRRFWCLVNCVIGADHSVKIKESEMINSLTLQENWKSGEILGSRYYQTC